METKHLKKYAPIARREFIEAVTNKAAVYGLLPEQILPMKEEGDVVIIGERPFPKQVGAQRRELERRIQRDGFNQFIEAIAYTWFNRFVAIRYMELHGYLEHGYRVLSHPDGKALPEILENAERVELSGLNRDAVVDLKLDGGKDEQLYQMLLLAQCNALHKAMPFLFESVKDGTELLLPDNLLHTDSLVRGLVNEIPEEQWQEVEIIGWLYQFYISEKKDEVIGKVVKSEDIPAATQLFTPNWIVRYMLHNTLGRKWMATYPDSPLKEQMEFYIEPAEQTLEVQRQLDEIIPDSLNPEELTLLDPACGSGHILVEAYDLFKAIYLERGYRPRDIPALIMTKNLFGLEIDDRAAQLAGFALLMKARDDDKMLFSKYVQPQIKVIRSTEYLDIYTITESIESATNDVSTDTATDISQLFDIFRNGCTIGSLAYVSDNLSKNISRLKVVCEGHLSDSGLFEAVALQAFIPIIDQAIFLCQQYDVVVTNPPYMNTKAMPSQLKEFASEFLEESKADTFTMFIKRGVELTKSNGYTGMVTPMVWMFLSTYEEFRDVMLSMTQITSLVQLEYNAFEPACVPISTFVLQKRQLDDATWTFIRLCSFRGSATQAPRTLEAISSPDCKWRFRASSNDFHKIPGHPIVYWLGEQLLDLFQTYNSFGDVCKARRGLTTWDNLKYLRLWFEVASNRFTPSHTSCDNLVWVPYNKGGPARRWGNNSLLCVWWVNNGAEIRQRGPATGEEWYLSPGITWSGLTSSAVTFRYSQAGFIFDSNKGPMMFPTEKNIYAVLAFLNSSFTYALLNALNPTLSTQNYDIDRLPYIVDDLDTESLTDLAKEAVTLSNEDWNSDETSWEFRRPICINAETIGSSVKMSVFSAIQTSQKWTRRLREIEADIDSMILKSLKLSDVAVDSVPPTAIGIKEGTEEEIVKSLLSYAVGVILGRYSLVIDGLIYAGSGGIDFDFSMYGEFLPDGDGIVPITSFPWFEDDLVIKFEAFVSHCWPIERFEENLQYIAQAIGAKGGEQSSDTIRRYFNSLFFKEHLQRYKGPKYPPRPIYWLFSSGKQRAFQCLVYLHRYNAGTLSRMRTEYVVKLQGKINSRIEQLESDIPSADSTSHRKKLEKELNTLIKQREELITFDEKLRHYADQRIELDLDDGVKVNYGKFGDLLAEVKAITGEKPK